MARAIDADRLLQELMKMEVLTLDRKDLFTGPARIAVFGMIGEQPTLTPPTEWVSVEERLPRVGGNYICAVQDKNGGTWTIPAEWNLEMKTWFGAFGEIKNKVTHWMPLPAPPNCRPPEGGVK